ncbi:IclR family transcriptional regulator domain-containing protein [Lysinibacillus sp. NPDC094177]|uniref:IclR family transcriptional regulator domain-containing protein n=1 Tax=Lysinibacillus sp. NPDC094177 TaxID=3390580 RepID=UPI003D05F9DB
MHKKTFYDYSLLIPHLQVIKAQGYAVDNEETHEGKCCKNQVATNVKATVSF